MVGRTLAAAALGLLVASHHLGAQSDGRPTITVTPFTPDRLNKESRAVGAQFADDLAALLVESGRFRVLARDWMPLPAKDRSGQHTVAAIRQAATKAGVQYVVFGSMRSSTRREILRPPITYVPTRRGQLFSRIIQASVPKPRPAAKSVTYYSIELELIDASSGELVRTMRARSETNPETAMHDVADTLARLSTQLSCTNR